MGQSQPLPIFQIAILLSISHFTDVHRNKHAQIIEGQRLDSQLHFTSVNSLSRLGRCVTRHEIKSAYLCIAGIPMSSNYTAGVAAIFCDCQTVSLFPRHTYMYLQWACNEPSTRSQVIHPLSNTYIWRPGKIAYWTSLKVYTLRIKVVRWRSLLTWFGLNVYDPTANKMLLVIQRNLNLRAKHNYKFVHMTEFLDSEI